MNKRELVHRLLEQAHIFILRVRFVLGMQYRCADEDSVPHFIKSRQVLIKGNVWRDIPVQDRKAIREGTHDVFGYLRIFKGGDDWFASNISGNFWEKARFFADIDYRQGNPTGDIRVMWEYNRLQHLVNMALLFSQDEADHGKEIAEVFVLQLNDWIENNPPLRGPNYLSAMECGLRIISVTVAYDLLRSLFTEKHPVQSKLTQMVYEHARLIEHRISMYSSAGNHTIAECAGLLFAALLFPEFKESEKWYRKSSRIFYSEISRQILNDGGGIEQAIWYHAFVVDLLNLVVNVSESTGKPVPDAGLEKLKLARGYLASFADDYNELPGLGDKDNGYALSRYLKNIWVSRNNTEQVICFDESGQTVIKGLKGQMQLIFDHGPLGMLPSCGHGHADALSVVLGSREEAFLIDSGTCTYTGDQQLRRYFRGTRAHNTVTIDGQDQAVQQGPFLWSGYFEAEKNYIKQGDNGRVMLVANHPGYSKLGVTHWRAVIILEKHKVIIIDFVEGSGSHHLELNWHFKEQAVKAAEGVYTASGGLLAVDGGESRLVSAQSSPPFGWYSDVYGICSPCHTVSTTYSGLLPHTFTTYIDLECEPADEDLIRHTVHEVEMIIKNDRTN